MMIFTSTSPAGTRSLKTRRAAILLGLLFLLGTHPLHAAEADDESDGATSDSAETSASETSTSGPASEVFIPTEEISEDFAVSFPVDI